MGVKVRKRAGKWWVFVDYANRRKSKCIGTREAAEKVKRVLESKLALGDFGFPADSADIPTFEKYAERWLREYAGVECKPSTRRSYEQLLRLHVTPRFGQKKLTDISRNDTKHFLGELSRSTKIVDEKTGATAPKFSRNTMRLIVCALRAVLNAALEDGIIVSNPASRVGKFTKSEKPAHQAAAMTRQEAEQFLAAVQEICSEWFPFFLTALRAGLRKGELIALKWGDIQFGTSEADSNRYILVQRNWACDEFTTPKSKKSRRVDLSRQLRQVLLKLRDEQLLQGFMQGHTSITDNLVFPSQAGTPIKPDNIAVRYMQPALEKAGLRKFRFHISVTRLEVC
jgi:integrase